MTSEEYNICVNQYADRVFRYVLKNIRLEADARDIVQRSFEKMWMKHKDVDFKKAKSYLFTTAYHTLVDWTRKNKRTSVVEQVPEKVQLYRENAFELKDSLHQALNQLTDIQKKVVLLRDYEGYSYKEIAEIADISEAQVKVYIFRARKKLHQILSQNNEYKAYSKNEYEQN